MLRVRQSNNERRNGFTIVELLVIAPVVILTIGAFITIIVSMTGDVLTSRSANTTLFSIQDSLNRIEQDVKLSSSFLATNSITPQTGQGFDDATAGFKNISVANGTMLILNSIATTGNPLASTSAYVYAIDPLNACGTAGVIQNTPESTNVIYFVKSGTLWRRTIMQSTYTNTSTNWCNLAWQLPSCSPGYTATFCKTQDIQLVSGLGTTGFIVQYFNGSSTTSENTTASDSSVSDTNRAAALVSATTAAVSLSSTQSIAGRSNTQSATLRATRLDINASSIVIPVAPSTPTAPTVTASYTPPTTAVFSWPAVNGASTYTIDYSLNGGTSWTNGFTSQNLTTFSYSGAQHAQVVSVRVSATNSAGTSSYGTTSITIPRWVTPVLQNNWSDFGSTNNTAAYTKTSDGLVVFKGLIQRAGTIVIGETLFTLPVGYRPSYIMAFAVGSNGAGATLYVNPDGTVVASTNSSAAWLSLETVEFLPSTSSYTWTNLAMLNGYSNRNATNDPPFSYTIDGNSRVNIRGALTPGTQTDGTIIESPALPVGYRPLLYMHIAIRSGGNGYNLVGQDTSGNMLAKGGAAGTAVFMNYSFLSTAYSGTWNTPTMLNGWVAHTPATYSTPQYTKTADGMVVLKGLIKSGTTSAAAFVLPAGYRPSAQVVADSICNSLWCRIDIQANGTVFMNTGTSATWSSLDGLSFFAEQ